MINDRHNQQQLTKYMKVLIVSLSNVGGGASRAVANLYSSLKCKNIDVELLLFEGVKIDNKTSFVYNNKFSKLIFRIKNKFTKIIMGIFRNPSNDLRSINIFPSMLLHKINASNADIVNIHWIGSEMISIEQIPQINKPIVLTLHDAWLLNGMYHISPSHYYPLISENGTNLLDRWCICRKKKMASRKTLHIVSPSQWIKNDFLKSYFNNGKNTCDLIRNIIDDNVWKAYDKKSTKEELNFDLNKINVLFIANNATKSLNKGFQFVTKLTEMCSNNFIFNIVGSNDIINLKNANSLGIIKDSNKLAKIYSASDICLIPSMSENLPNVALEALMCNTPVLCFDTTGLKDIIKNNINGYRAKKFDIDDLFYGLNILASFKHNNCLINTIKEFNSEINTNKYIELFDKYSRSH